MFLSYFCVFVLSLRVCICTQQQFRVSQNVAVSEGYVTLTKFREGSQTVRVCVTYRLNKTINNFHAQETRAASNVCARSHETNRWQFYSMCSTERTRSVGRLIKVVSTENGKTGRGEEAKATSPSLPLSLSPEEAIVC